MFRCFRFSLVLPSIFSFAAAAKAGVFADSSISYDQGAISALYSSYNNPATALGKPNDDVNAGQPFGYGALTPFNATWQPTEMVGIGTGGHLTMHLGQTAWAVGVHAGVGLIDIAYPNGKNSDPATPYVEPRSATVSVSGDGTTFVPIGLVNFDRPSNFYDQGVTMPGSQVSPGTHEADFSRPFFGSLSDFNDKDWTATLALLDGSAAGNWINVLNVLPTGANFIRFDVGSDQVMFVDAVATAVIPEPAAIGLLIPVAMFLKRNRRR